MTRLPGTNHWDTSDGYLGRLAAVLPDIHALAAGPELPDYEPYALQSDGPPPWVDVGHCRMDLARGVGAAAADRFLELYCALTGRSGYEPYWDVAAVLGGFEVGDWTPADERFIARSLGG